MSSAPDVASRTFSFGRVLLGFLIAALVHPLAIGCFVAAGRAVQSSGERDFRPFEAAFGAFLLVEVSAMVAMIVAVVLLVRRRRRDLALGIVLGWLAGPAVLVGGQLVG